jgi:hypothetical protein
VPRTFVANGTSTTNAIVFSEATHQAGSREFTQVWQPKRESPSRYN